MGKRIVTAVLCLALLLCALPFGAAASTTDAEIRRQIVNVYNRTLAATGKESLHGYCGLMTAYQLYYLGVDTAPLIYNGKDEYDAYKNLEYSSGGHKIRKYPAYQYSLEEALYTMCSGGNRDVYNVLIGFESTITEAGSLYGHAVVIHAILDGNVYFSESFYDSQFGPAGTPVCFSIERFVAYYSDWTTFEGAVEFGKKNYGDMCRVYAANQFVQLPENTDILAEICEIPSQAKVLRTAQAGERLAATAVYEDADGRLYYRIDDSGAEGFVPAEKTEHLQGNYSDIVMTEYTAPEALKAGENFRAKVTLEADYNCIHAIKVRIRDAMGNQVLTCEEPVSGCLGKMDEKLLTESLPEGAYTYEIIANVINYYAVGDVLSADYESITLHSAGFVVGEAEIPVMARSIPGDEVQQTEDGWFVRDGVWYCYQDGAPRTGWYTEQGIKYYLQPDGAVTTGWAMVEGKGRFFSSTGAMRCGWLEMPHHTYYMCDSGTAVRGWLQLDADRYYFQENGWMLKDTWLELEDGKYYLLSDGKAATGWHTLEGQNYYFDENGKLFSHVYEENGEDVVCLHLEDASQTICFPALKAYDE